MVRAEGHGSPQALGLHAADRALARAFLRPREESWNDGDDNLIRDHLDRWSKTPAPPSRSDRARTGSPESAPGLPGDAKREHARVLLDAARSLAQMKPRAETLWCFLWHLESHLPAVLEDD